MGKRILCVDDDPQVRALFERLLTQEGYEVVTAKDGIEGLASVASRSFDLIISDVMMPHLDGYDLTTELKKNPATKDIPLLIVTARATALAAQTAKLYGAAECLFKPFGMKELLETVEKLLATD